MDQIGSSQQEGCSLSWDRSRIKKGGRLSSNFCGATIYVVTALAMTCYLPFCDIELIVQQGIEDEHPLFRKLIVNLSQRHFYHGTLRGHLNSIGLRIVAGLNLIRFFANFQ